MIQLDMNSWPSVQVNIYIEISYWLFISTSLSAQILGNEILLPRVAQAYT